MTYTISFHNEIMFSFNFVITERKCMNISPICTVSPLVFIDLNRLK